jgi:phage shock protein PspC (stress-responsive transcriptional regulator)
MTATATASPSTPPDLPARLRAARRGPGGPLAGVCEGLGRATGVDPLVVRVIFVALATAGGAGIILYVVLALVLPRARTTAGAARAVRVNVKETAGVALLALSVLLSLRGVGLWWSDAVVLPAVLTSTGVAVIWRHSALRGRRDGHGDAEGATSLRTPGGVPFGPGAATPLGELPRLGPRLIGGAVLVAAGGAALLQATAAVGTLRDLAVATVVVLAGVTLIFGTSWFGLVRTLRVERAERIRSQDRAEMAAHLHDSVLQTLALIQRHSGDDREVATLARRQERELRDWLAGRPVVTAEDTGTTLASALHAMAAGVEGRPPRAGRGRRCRRPPAGRAGASARGRRARGGRQRRQARGERSGRSLRRGDGRARGGLRPRSRHGLRSGRGRARAPRRARVDRRPHGAARRHGHRADGTG